MSVYQYITTKEQEATIKRLELEDHVIFRPENVVGAVVFEDYEVVCYYFYSDGTYLKESREFTSDGWSQTSE